jgi:hypothetical protein
MASTYLTRTPSSDGNLKIMTFSFWMKRSNLTSNAQRIFSINENGGADQFWLRTADSSNDYIDFFSQTSSSQTLRLVSNARLRDTSGWYHIVIAVDTTQATDSNRIKMYINGVQQTSFSTTSYPSQNTDLEWNKSVPNIIGKNVSSEYFDGLLSHVYFIDGTAYDADTFGEYDSTTGIWTAKFGPSVTYGTNGFFLKFENSGAFGTDSSGNGNTFTVNGTMTQTIDTPSNVFTTWNALDKHASSTLSNGNTKYATSGTSQYEPAKCTLGFSAGKYYSEHQINSLSTTACYIGIYGTSVSGQSQSEMDTSRFSYNVKNGEIIKNASNLQTGLATFTTNDILGIEVDCDAGTLKFYKNGTQVGTTITDSDISSTEWSFGTQPRLATFSSNFGNGYFGTTAVSSAQNPDDGIGIFEYAVPTGYRALCTKSINAEEYD